LHLVDHDDRTGWQRVHLAAKPGWILGIAEERRLVREVGVEAGAEAPAERRFADLARSEKEDVALPRRETAPKNPVPRCGSFTS
jgi:hypothetical protein